MRISENCKPESSSILHAWTSSILHEPLTVVYIRNKSIFPEQWSTPLLFHNFEVSQGVHSQSLKVWLSALFFICTCACTHLVLSNDTKLLLKFTELEIKSVCVPGHGIKEPVYVLCCQSNEALEKTEVVPIVNAGSDILSHEYAPTSGATPRCSHITDRYRSWLDT